MLRGVLFRLATWRDPRNQITDADRAEAQRIRENPSIEGKLKVEKALAALRYIRELSA